MAMKAEEFANVEEGDLFDIPAAEEEVTVGGANENDGHYHEESELHTQEVPMPPKRPKIIMLQRSSLTGGLNHGFLTNNASGSPNIKTLRIIKVPSQGGIPGKPGMKTAVIPMQLLNRNIRVINAAGAGKLFATQGGLNLQNAAVAGGAPRILTLRPSQPNMVMGTPSFLQPGAQSQAAFTMHHMGGSGEDVENQMIDLGGHQHMQSGGQLIELAPGPPGSPNRDFLGDDFDPSLNQPLKTNGLRRYARCVCNKVKEKGVTSYSEVADELVHEYAAEHPMIPSEQLHYIQKNIRRRVYDALNVLMALNVLQKEKKEIHWVGLPVNMIEECKRLEEEREKRQISLRNKTTEIQELILQLIAFKTLVVRNKLNEQFQQQQLRNAAASKPAAGAGQQQLKKVGAKDSAADEINMLADGKNAGYLDRIKLPFLIAVTNKKTIIDTLISEDRLQYVFSFDQGFELRDDVEILKRMGLTLRLGTPQCQQEEFNQCLELVPASMRFYVEAIKARRQAIVPDFEALHVQRRMYVEARMASEMNHQHQEGTNGNGYHDDAGPPAKQIHFQQRGGSRQQDLLVPGDTHHYARAAVNRGYLGSMGRNRHMVMEEAGGSGSMMHPVDEALMQTTVDIESRRMMRQQQYILRRNRPDEEEDEELPPDDEDELPEEDDEDDGDMEDVEY